MESSELLETAERGRAALAAGLQVPRGYDAVIGGGLSALIAANAVDVASDGVAAKVLFVVAVLGLAIGGGWQVHRFRQLNGVWVSGLRRGKTVPATVAAMLVYGVGVFGAAAAGDAGLWWLVVLIALAAGGGYVLLSQWWMRLYRTEQGA